MKIKTHTCFGQRVALEIRFGRYNKLIAELSQRILGIETLGVLPAMSALITLILHWGDWANQLMLSMVLREPR